MQMGSFIPSYHLRSNFLIIGCILIIPLLMSLLRQLVPTQQDCHRDNRLHLSGQYPCLLGQQKLRLCHGMGEKSQYAWCRPQLEPYPYHMGCMLMSRDHASKNQVDPPLKYF
ncbi:hypothetical protein TNIN_71531 [Trichonephila inaurata madagascariensis]|uniref:Uncharacterized protein n=1 Tax=Trichonephila inaurata madagascariensis TaxID=2747483 RepID=A0A8X6IUS4_9ARAC|nr:hypothetical protein TNIN_71531 [Trichonephila inaurata madagascariensis]